MHGRYDPEFRIIHRSGEERYVHSEGQATFDAGGHPVRMEGTVQDITERRWAEEALRESEARFRTLIEEAPVAIGISRDGLSLYGNRAYLKMFGFERVEELIGRPIAENWSPEWRTAIADYAQRRSRGLPAPTEYEGIAQRKDGSPFPAHVVVKMVELPDGRATLGFITDITERKHAETALRDLNATLEGKVARRTAELAYRARQLQKLTLELTQAEEQERRRIAVILHEDLQQQVAGAKFHLDRVKSKVEDDRLRADIDEVGAILKGAIEQSRSLSYDLSPAVVNMNDLAEVLQWLAHRVGAQQGLTVNLHVCGDLRLHSEALTMFLFRATQEMLFNVVKHAQVREAAVRVRRIGRYVCLSVSDQGRGFDPRELKEASGVGLFSIRERTELLGGRMKIKSAKGKGSKFIIVVPHSPKAKVKEMTTEDVGYASATVSSSSNGALRVLLADDHDVVRAGLAAMLREAPGIELVGEAPDGRKAINMAVDLRPDVVIMDVSMPMMRGDEATRQIKRYLPNTRVIALSMYDEADKKQSMFEAGAEGYILKTISAEDLIAAIRGRE